MIGCAGEAFAAVGESGSRTSHPASATTAPLEAQSHC